MKQKSNGVIDYRHSNVPRNALYLLRFQVRKLLHVDLEMATNKKKAGPHANIFHFGSLYWRYLNV